MPDLPSMSIFWDAYMLDTMHLTDEEHGAYFRLLGLAWISPQCRLPNDDEWLARRLCRDISVIKTLYRPVLSEFFQTDGNWLWQKRQRREFSRARATTLSRRKAGLKGAQSKYLKDKENDGGKRDGRAMAPTPTPTPTERKKETPPVSPSKRGKKKSGWPDGFFLDGPMRAYAEQSTPGVDADADFEKFENHHRAKGSMFVDWKRAWQNWCRSEFSKPMRSNGNGKSRTHRNSTDDAIRETARRLGIGSPGDAGGSLESNAPYPGSGRGETEDFRALDETHPAKAGWFEGEYQEIDEGDSGN